MTAPERIWADWDKMYPEQNGGQWWGEKCNATEYIRADLAAVQPAPVRVKPLVWEEQDGKSYRQANCVFGQYQVSFLCEFECWQLSKPQKPEQAWGESFSRHSHKDAAKSAAQADYEARILAALEPQPDPRDEVIARLVGALEMAKVWLDYNGAYDMQGINAALAAAKAVQK